MTSTLTVIDDRQLTLLPNGNCLHTTEPDDLVLSEMEQALRDIFPSGPPAWNIAAFVELTQYMVPGDGFITSLSLPAETILSLDKEERLLWTLGNNVSFVVIHGGYDPRSDTTAMTVLNCCSPNQDAPMIHVLSSNFFSSFGDGDQTPTGSTESQAWNTALRLFAGFITVVDANNLVSSLPDSHTDRFSEIRWIGCDANEPVLRASSTRIYATKKE